MAAGISAAETNDALELFETHCVRCHGGEKIKGGLDLTTQESLLRGGESGLAIVDGNSDASLLVKSIRHQTESHMPFKEKKLSDEAIATIANWVRAGAPYSRTLKAMVAKGSGEFTLSETDRAHWAFQPLKRPTPPKISGVENPIDGFVLERLRAAGLGFSPKASRTQLIRRVTFDLIGLPPTPQEVEAFVNDHAPNAYERLIDRLLASPQYGERWGRHWLDLARFAESDGFEHDAVRPHSWRYRDYVVNAFNEDKPYDRFIREQLAGDELFPGDPEAITATAFNLLGPDMVDSSDQVQRRHNTLNDMTDTAALTFLGLTVGCARCHDHKFEPLAQKDYYALQAFFVPAKFETAQAIPTIDEQRRHDEAARAFNEQPEVRALTELEAGPRQKVYERKLTTLSAEAQMAHRTPPEQRNAEQSNLVLETLDKVAVSEDQLAAEFSPEEKGRRKKLQETIKMLPRPAALPMTMALADRDLPAKANVLTRGDYAQPGDEVAAGFPAVLRTMPNAPAPSRKPRAVLADWIASPENPLTARVMVNRIWQHHFGRGLVGSPSNFGTHGQAPTHPELLDWLASEFVASGWSIKHMHKLMLLSETYQQVSSSLNGAAVDPDNKLYGRMNRLRLEGEVIRDSLLAISGQLQTAVGGPGVFPPISKELFEGVAGWPSSKSDPKQNRRSIYIFARRNLRFPFLEVFDLPDNNLSCPARERSATAPQSLTLLNSNEVIQAAKLTAAMVGWNPVEDVYRRILNRPPSKAEMEIASEFLKTSPLEELCRALFNLNDFIYAE